VATAMLLAVVVDGVEIESYRKENEGFF